VKHLRTEFVSDICSILYAATELLLIFFRERNGDYDQWRPFLQINWLQLESSCPQTDREI